jgi:hypothetical protein
MNSDLPDIFEWDRTIYCQPHVSDATVYAYLKRKYGKPIDDSQWPNIIKFRSITFSAPHVSQTALNAYLKRERKPKKISESEKQRQILVRNTARSLTAKPKDSWADWTQPKWETGGNPGLFVEGGDCCPK